jgi:hypothetical protein
MGLSIDPSPQRKLGSMANCVAMDASFRWHDGLCTDQISPSADRLLKEAQAKAAE